MPVAPLRAIRSRASVSLPLACCALALLSAFAPNAFAETPRVHAIVGARIVAAPGQVIARGNVIVRDGLIVAVGANAAVPADARVWKGDSLTVYAGLIDAFVPLAADAAARPGGTPAGGGRPAPAPVEMRGAAASLASIRPEDRVAEMLPLSKDQLESLRAAGFTVAHVAPRLGIVRGQSAVVALGDGAANANVVKADASQVISLESVRAGYPGSLMGAIALIRQTFLDAKWYRDANAAYARNPSRAERPDANLSLQAMQPVIAGTQLALFVADDMLEVSRAAALAREAGVAVRIVGTGDEYKRLRSIAATGASLVVPVNFPEAPDVSDPDLAIEVSTEQLRAWQDAPSNLAEIAKQPVTFSLTSNGLKDVKNFRANVGKAIARGLAADRALAAVTTEPAALLGLSGRLGTIAPGKIANLTVMRGDLFSEQGVVREVWVDGNRYETTKDATTPKGDWRIDWGSGPHALKVAVEKDTTVTLVVGADSLRARNVVLEGQRARFTVERTGQAAEDFDVTAANDAIAGTLMVKGVGSHAVSGVAVKKDEKKPAAKEERVASPAVMGNTEAWRAAMPPQQTVLVRNATIWTAGPQGTLANADLLVRGGKIAGVGKSLAAPSGAVVIDEHSHAAVLGNVNECTNSITCEVRIQDVINSESINIYRQLAGGTTMMHLLHGSCNSIGGQCAVIKNKWGATADELFMADAPPTVKFALGENPKQANWGADRTGRYPQSRGGVEQTIREGFLAARDYLAQQEEFRTGKRALPPRRDLQLDALADIVSGRMLIHCHSYRQDEILMLMRLAEEFGFRVNTFTHILEGYKVADEMAAHGSSAMGFSDWWGYKQEVIDAIPWNGYLMWDRGVNVGFNSDSEELARRLNSEAGKAIKYGGMPPDEAIKTVTINPARSLKIDGRVGSLEVGKDADFAIWNGPPMSALTRCEQTWIEGRKYFDRSIDLAGREALAKERDALIAAVKASKKDGAAGEAKGKWPPRYLEATDMSGNDCDAHAMPFLSEAERRARQDGEVQR